MGGPWGGPPGSLVALSLRGSRCCWAALLLGTPEGGPCRGTLGRGEKYQKTMKYLEKSMKFLGTREVTSHQGWIQSAGC